MNKKFLFFALLAALCSFIVAGCDSSDDDPVFLYTPVNLDDPSTLAGTYEIDYFITDALMFKITNNCAMANVLWGNTGCNPGGDVQMASKAVIVQNGDGTYSLSTKMQIWGGIFSSSEVASLGELVTDNMYNYTAYSAVNADSIDRDAKYINRSGTIVQGVSGRNMTSVTHDDAASFYFTLQPDGTIISDLNLTVVGGLQSNTKVVLRKVSDTPEALDPNALVDESAPGFENFDSQVYPTPVDLSDFETLQGEYDVTFFGSGVENVRPAEFASFAAYNYITNNADFAISAGLCTDNSESVNPGSLPFCSGDSQTNMIGGKLVITVDNGQINITSKMQMDGEILNFSPSDKYQYTEYYPTNALTGTGVKGYNFDAETGLPSSVLIDNPTSPFTISFEDRGGELKINLILKDKSVLSGMVTVDANTLVYAKKVSNKTTPLTNELFQPFTAGE